jgi:cytochrome c oxidase assembly factor CtaG
VDLQTTWWVLLLAAVFGIVLSIFYVVTVRYVNRRKGESWPIRFVLWAVGCGLCTVRYCMLIQVLLLPLFLTVFMILSSLLL